MFAAPSVNGSQSFNPFPVADSSPQPSKINVQYITFNVDTDAIYDAEGRAEFSKIWQLISEKYPGQVVVCMGKFYVSKEVLRQGLENLDAFHDTMATILGKEKDANQGVNHYYVEGNPVAQFAGTLRDNLAISPDMKIKPEDFCDLKDITGSVNNKYSALTADFNEDNFNITQSDSFFSKKYHHETTNKTKATWKRIQISVGSIVRALMVVGLAGAYYFRQTKVGMGFAIGTAAVGGSRLLMLLMVRGLQPLKPKVPTKVAKLFNSIKRGNWGHFFSGATTFGTVSLAQLVAVHYAVKPLAGRNVPLLSGFARGAMQQAARCPTAVRIGALLAISTLFTFMSVRSSILRRRESYERI